MTTVDAEVVAVVVVRDGRLPAGADEAVAEASGRVVLVGIDPARAAAGLVSARDVWTLDLAVSSAEVPRVLAAVLEASRLVILPGSPDGRDLAPGLALALDRPLLAGAVRCWLADGLPQADLLRADGRVVVTASADGPVVATLMPGSRSSAPTGVSARLVEIEPPPVDRAGDLVVRRLVEPDPATMDLADAPRVLAGGAGLVRRGASDTEAKATFELLGAVAAALGASAGATRVVTDAGWMRYERQIGTTGVWVDPDLYVALGVSGASQHVAGLGSPRLTVSVNSDPSCPMTAMADLGVVADAPSMLVELARRLGVGVPALLAGGSQ